MGWGEKRGNGVRIGLQSFVGQNKGHVRLVMSQPAGGAPKARNLLRGIWIRHDPINCVSKNRC